MTRCLSIYLDAVRFVAALVVFFSHLSGQRFTGGIFWQFGPYGNQAVTVFFVLSGFVIAFVSSESHSSKRSYTVARISRVYSVAIPTLIITFILDRIGTAVNPEMYNDEWGFAGDLVILRYVTALTFTGQLWWSGLTVGSNLPYWSLQFEVWYYLIYGIILFGRGRRCILTTTAACIVAGPPMLVLFPIWLLGVATYHATRRLNLTHGQAWACTFGSIFGWLANEALKSIFGTITIGNIVHRSMLIEDYIIAVLFSIHVIGFSAATQVWSPREGRLVHLIRWLAGGSFTLYLLHLPIGQFLASVSPWPSNTAATRIVVLGGTLVAVFVVAHWTERRKAAWRQFFDSALTRLGWPEQSPAHIGSTIPPERQNPPERAAIKVPLR